MDDSSDNFGDHNGSFEHELNGSFEDEKEQNFDKKDNSSFLQTQRLK